MRVPQDRSLAAWIRELDAAGKLYKFYKTEEWLDLRDDILDENHWECALCKEQGKYSRAVTVHHVIEVKDRPELALARIYVDVDGTVHVQLLPLCFKCHNKVHGRFGHAKPRKFITEERW